MVSVVRTFHVKRERDEVVGFLADFGRAEQWDPGTVTCRRTDDGPVAVGARWRNVSRFLGRETVLDYRLERWDPDHLTFVGTNKTATSVDDMTFVPDDPGTTITYRATIRFNGLSALADPLMRLVFERLASAVVTRMTSVVNDM